MMCPLITMADKEGNIHALKCKEGDCAWWGKEKCIITEALYEYTKTNRRKIKTRTP